MLTPSERRILGILAVSAPLSCLSLPASALTIQDFHPNCDIRQLNLSRDQYESLRGLRGEYKQAVEKLNLQNRGSERPLRDNLLELEIKLARLKVTAAQIRQEKMRQQWKKQRVDLVGQGRHGGG